MDGKEETQVIAARVRAPVANRMAMLLLTKGYEEAERVLTVLNNMFATEEWWAPVYREMVQMLLDFAMKQQQKQVELQRQKEEKKGLLLGGVHITNMMTGSNKEETSVSGNMFNLNNNKEVNLNG